MFSWKKLIAAAIFVCISVFMITTVFADNQAVISGDNVNVRKEPNTNCDVIKQLKSGDVIDIISVENGWFKIREASQPSGIAYVTGQYITILQIDCVINDNRINIREGASTDTTVLGVLEKGDKISLTGKEGNFYMFAFEGRTAFVFIDFVDIPSDFKDYVQEHEHVDVMKFTQTSTAVKTTSVGGYTYGKVISSNGVNFRKGAAADADKYFALAYGEVVDLISINGEWVKVSYGGIEGYIIKEFLELCTGTKPVVNARLTKANALIAFSKQYLGTPYVWGGTNLSKGVDCSGFTYSVFKNFGYALNRSSRDQAKNGTRVASKAELLPGDLVFFDTNKNNTISHVGIYIGGGQFIHSCSGSRSMKVIISSLGEAYYVSRYMGGSRIIN